MKENVEKFSFNNLSKYRTALMGLAIISIIIFHFTEDCRNYNVRFDGIISFYYTYIHSSGVDIFLFLSGLGLYYSWKKQPGYISFYKKRFLRILVPYFIVATPASIWFYLYYEGDGITTFLERLTFVSFFTEKDLWFWYVLMILICYLMFPFIFHIIETADNKLNEFLRLLALCAAATIFTLLLKQFFYELYSNIAIMLTRFPCFILGVWAGKNAYENRNIPFLYVIIGSLITIVMMGPLNLIDQNYILQVYLIALCSLIIYFIVLHLACMPFANSIPSLTHSINIILNWFGNHSYELYLTHIALRKIMNVLGFRFYRFSHEMLLIVLSILLSILLKKIDNSIIQKFTKPKSIEQNQ